VLMKSTKQRRKEKREALFTRNFHSALRVAWIRGLPCEVTGEHKGECVNAHMKSRGAGGTWRDIVPLSWECHQDFDTMASEKFQIKYRRTKNSIRRCSWYYARYWELQMEDNERNLGK
jgi:hypothetical protein